MLAYGKNVLLMMNPKEIKKVYLSKSKNDAEIKNFLKDNKIHFVVTSNDVLNKMVKGNHQGVVIEREEFKYFELKDIQDEEFLVILDHLEDPHKFGAIIRTAEAAGIKTIIIPKDRSVSVNDTVIKTSVGTTSNVKIVKVTNIAETIKKLQKEGYFVYGTSMDGKDCRDVDFSGKKVLIIGNEGKGISKIVEEKCDEIISIPMKGEVNSLNASVAAGILIFKMGGLS